jgi:hypothetical protein
VRLKEPPSEWPNCAHRSSVTPGSGLGTYGLVRQRARAQEIDLSSLEIPGGKWACLAFLSLSNMKHNQKSPKLSTVARPYRSTLAYRALLVFGACDRRLRVEVAVAFMYKGTRPGFGNTV